MANHQSPNQESEKLWRFGNVIADQIIKTIDGPIVLCYSGMSGIGTATSLMLALEDNKAWKHPIGMLYVRKDPERQQKGACSWHNICQPNSTYIFVDDHIAGGRTFNRCRVGLQTDVPEMVYKYGRLGDQPLSSELDHKGKPVVWPANRADWKPEITYIAVRSFGLERVKPPSAGYLIDQNREALFRKDVERKKWYFSLHGIA